MLLLYLTGGDDMAEAVFNLHSTMLLLYLSMRWRCRWRKWFTFHYASTLSESAIEAHKPGKKFTFHYASTLSRTDAGEKCLHCLFKFHYASTLSACDIIKYLCGFLIYIPLCFYFIKEVSENLRNFCCIYIPLCFYFIFIRSDRLRSRFHLHSTMLLLYPAPERKAVIPGYLFTFHYASTLSDIRAGNKPAGKDIYIPLCFYFIQE